MADVVLTRLPNLLTVFFGIFLEASPFLLFGVLVSSVLDVLVSTERLARHFPQNGVLGLVGGVALGAAAPLCECGTVPIARGSVARGLPLPAAIGFLLAAPVINPITVAATYTAFRNDLHILVLRILLGISVALAVGALFLLWPRQESPLRHPDGIGPLSEDHDHCHVEVAVLGEAPPEDSRWRPALRLATGGPALRRIAAVLEHAGHELSSLMVYLVGASIAAAVLQVFLPRQQLIALGQGPLLSVAIMMLIAVVLSTCSSVDAFVALAFSTTFAPGAILAFLLISPVLNLKSGALVVGIFRPRVTIPLLSAATATIVVAALAINYHLL